MQDRTRLLLELAGGDFDARPLPSRPSCLSIRANGRVVAYIYEQAQALKLVAKKASASDVGFADWDKEGNQWFGRHPSVEVKALDGDASSLERVAAFLRLLNLIGSARLA